MAWSEENLNRKMVRKQKRKMVRKQKRKMVRKQKTAPRVVLGPEEIKAMRERYVSGYREVLRKYEGFDLCGYRAPTWYGGPSPVLCDDRYNRCCDLVLLYARFGLHRYNLLQGKDLQLSRVERYNRSTGILVCSYFITLEANDPANDPATIQTFQARVDERKFNGYVLSCTVARLRGETKKSITGGCFHDRPFYDKPLSWMPELPPENPFKDDTNQFYVLKESELQDNDHWIRLYLELAVATTSRTIGKHALANLKILRVAMESTPYLSQGIHAHDATFYIRYEDSCEARVGKDVDRVAIVRRILEEQSEIFSLVGRHLSSQTIIPSNGSAAVEAGSSSAQD